MMRLLMLLLFLFAPPLVLPLAMVGGQDTVTLRITGVNATNLPTTVISATVTDSSGRAVPDLTLADFELSGAFADVGQVVSVETTQDDNVSFAVVLAIDTSSSMAGTPLQAAQDAARLFVDSLGDQDPVAIISFSNRPVLVADYTTDKAVLKSAIDSLNYGGQTALYDSIQLGVDTAERAPVDRRALIVLSDGAQYGVISAVTADEPLERARISGVSIYTIGLGFGADRPYLQRLAADTNATYSESPTPDQLQAIFSRLATLFRSQYIITVQADVPLDGTEYDLGLMAQTPLGASNIATATVRAPVPVPVVRLPAFDAPLSELTLVTPEVLADDGVATTVATLNDEAMVVTNGAVTIDPATLSPGSYTLTYTVTDTSGDTTEASADLEIAALPSTLAVALNPDDPVIAASTTVTVVGAGQTPLQSVTYSIGGETFTSEDVAGNFTTTLDPFTIPSGEQLLTVTATNEGGVSSTTELALLIAPIAPTTAMNGVTDGQELSDEVVIDAQTTTQAGAEVASSVLTVNGEPVEMPFTLNPANFPPGALNLILTTTDSNGQVTTQTLIVTVPNLGLSATAPDAGDISSTTSLPVEVTSQTPIVSASAVINGQTFTLTPEGNTVPLVIDPQAMGANGDYTATVTITNASGDTTTVEIPFSISGLTIATPLSGTAAASEVATTEVANVPTKTVTPNAAATQTSEAQAVADASATGFAVVAVASTSTQAAIDGALAQDARNATATEQSLNLTATQTAVVALNANATATQSIVNATVMQANLNATATQTAVVALNATATQNASNLMMTQNAQSTLTATTARATTVARVVTATAGAAASATNQAQATRAAATSEARQATSTAQVVAQVAGATQTAAADAAASIVPPTLEATSESTAEATVEASPTELTLTTIAITQTPVGNLQTGGDQTPPPQTDIMPHVICGGAALLLALLLFLLSRGRSDA